MPVFALVEQVQIVLGHQVGKCIRVVHRGSIPALVGGLQQVFAHRSLGRHRTDCLEESGRMDSPHSARHAGIARRFNDPRLFRLRQKRAHGHGAASLVDHFVWSEQIEGVFVASLDQSSYLIQGYRCPHLGTSLLISQRIVVRCRSRV